MNNFLRNSLMLVLAIGFLFSFSSCDDDDVVTPAVTQENGQPDGITKATFTYTVHVIPSSEGGRSAGLSGATVTVSQNGEKETQTVNEDGMAIFEDLLEGDVTVFASAEGFASKNVETTLTNSKPNVDRNQEVELSEATIVELPTLGAGLRGTLRYDDDKDGGARTGVVAANGWQVKFELDDNTIQPNVYTTTVGSDGSFAFTNVPNAAGTVTADTTISIDNVLYTFETSTSTTPTIKDQKDVGVLVASNEDDRVFKTGSVEGDLYGDFDESEFGAIDSTDFSETQAGIEVVIEYSGLPDNEDARFTTETNAQGEFSFSNLPATTGDISADITAEFDRTFNRGTGNNAWEETVTFSSSDNDITIKRDETTWAFELQHGRPHLITQ